MQVPVPPCHRRLALIEVSDLHRLFASSVGLSFSLFRDKIRVQNCLGSERHTSPRKGRFFRDMFQRDLSLSLGNDK